DKVAWSDTNAADADTNFSTYHLGIGTGVYWFMGGPGVDPHYDGTTTEAYNWGKQQAIRTLSDVAKLTVTYPVIFDDVEIPGNAPGISPAPDNGWKSVYTSPCSGKVSHSGISPALDRADFNGFFDEIAHNSTYTPGVYSSAPIWASIFGTGGYSHIKHTYEWTYLDDTSSLSHTPDGWCLRNSTTCAQFFGGVTSSDSNAVMWQWSGGGGTFNGVGDFDQIDANRTPAQSRTPAWRCPEVTGVLGAPVTWPDGLAKRLGHHVRSPMSRLSAVTSTDLTMMVSSSTPMATANPISVKITRGRVPSVANVPASTRPAEV